MRGGFAAIQQTGIAQHESAQTQADDQRALRMTPAQGLGQFGRRVQAGIAPCRHDDDIGTRHRLQPIGHFDHHALFATDLPRLCSAIAHFVMRQVRCILGCAKDHSGHGQVEQAHAIERQDGNAKHGHRRSVLEKKLA